MVPCECGKQFNDLTDWKSHSYVTGHCCIYKCRKTSSAASIRGFALESGTSTFITHRFSDRNATATSKTRLSERHYPPSSDFWKGLAYSNLDPTNSCYPLLGTSNTPAASIMHPPKGWPQLPDAWQAPTPFTMHPAGVCSPFPDAVWKVPECSTRQPNLAYQSPDGTTWPAPVPLTKFQTAAHYHSLNSRPALILTAIPHSVVTPSTKSVTSPTPMPRQMPPARDSNSRPTTSSTPETTETPTAAVPLAPTAVKTNHVTAKFQLDDRPYGCSHCKRTFRAEESLAQHYKASHPGHLNEVFEWKCDTCKKSFNGLHALEDHQWAKKHCYCGECEMIFDFESTTVKHFKTFHASQFWCCDCEQEFVSEHALDQHLNDKVHQRIPCQVCRQDFGSKPALDRHIVGEHHASVNPKRVFYRKDAQGCYICQRQFVEEIDLEQHLTSLKHHPLSDLGCVASDECKRRFVSPSALLHHLESGTCCSGITGRIVNDLVQANDPERIISSDPAAQSLLQYNRNPSEYSSSSGTPVFTPTSSASSSPVAASMTNNSGEQAVPFWSLDAEIRSFDTIPGAPTSSTPGFLTSTPPQTSFHFDLLGQLPSLESNQAPALFHCPGGALASSTPHRVAPRHFSTLSGLAQHIESGACGQGSATLKKAMAFVQERLDKWGLANISLLK